MPDKRFVRSLIPVVLVAALAGPGNYCRTEAAPPPEKLTPDTFEAIKARLSLTPEDLAWQQVHWRDGYFEGLLEAQAADKPMFYWFYGGDPRGNC